MLSQTFSDRRIGLKLTKPIIQPHFIYGQQSLAEWHKTIPNKPKSLPVREGLGK